MTTDPPHPRIVAGGAFFTKGSQTMAPVRDLKTHPACLVGVNNRGRYASAVNDWLREVCRTTHLITSRSTAAGSGSRARAIRPVLSTPRPTTQFRTARRALTDLLLTHQGNYAAARKQILQIALDLLAEGARAIGRNCGSDSKARGWHEYGKSKTDPQAEAQCAISIAQSTRF